MQVQSLIVVPITSTAVTTTEVVDQALGRGIVGQGFLGARQAVVDALAQFLAQLHAPLVKGVDAPDDALYEYFVFIHRHQRAALMANAP